MVVTVRPSHNSRKATERAKKKRSSSASRRKQLCAGRRHLFRSPVDRPTGGAVCGGRRHSLGFGWHKLDRSLKPLRPQAGGTNSPVTVMCAPQHCIVCLPRVTAGTYTYRLALVLCLKKKIKNSTQIGDWRSLVYVLLKNSC